MRVFNRLIAASVATLVAGLLIAVTHATPASAAAGVHTMSVGVASVTEGNAGITGVNVTVSLNFAPFPGENISATVSTADGTARTGNPVSDYNSNQQTISFPCSFSDCSTSKTFRVDVRGDTSNEPDETIRIVLSQVQGATAGSNGTVTITDDDAGAIPTFAVTDSPAAPEGNADNVRSVKVKLNNPSDQEVTLNYATGEDTATANPAKGTPDFTAISTTTLTWPAGNTDEKSIDVTINGDTIGEPNENVAVNFGSPNNAALPDNQAFIPLTNDDGAAPVISLVETPAKAEGNAGTTDTVVTLSITPAAQQNLTVDYTTGDGSAVVEDDYEETKGTLTIATGQTSKTIAVPIVGDQAAEPDETYTVTLSKPTNATIGTASQSNTITNDDFGTITTSPGAGRVADIRLFGPAGAVLAGFPAYEAAFTGGAHVARGDFFKADGSTGGDGIDEIVVGPGVNSRPLVKILNASDGSLRASFLVFDPNFRGGSFVAAGNLDADASNGDELIVGAGPGGGPHVRVLRVQNSSGFAELGGVFAYDPRFSGGVHLAVGDLVGDVRDEVIVAPGPGGGPHVKIIGLSAQGQPSIVGEFMAYDPRFPGGVWVAAAGKKLITGAGPGGGPHVRIFTGAGVPEGDGFMAYGANFLGGVSVGAGNLDGDIAPEIVTGAGPGGGPHVRAFELNGDLPFGGGFSAYESFTGGVEVAIGNG